MNLKYLLCCESSAVDQFTDRLSAFNILDKLNAPSYPVSLPGLTIIVCLEKEAAEPNAPDLSIRISLNGQELATYKIDLQFGDALLARSIGSIQGFFITEPGLLAVDVMLEGADIGKWEVRCVQIGQPELQLQQPLAAPQAPA